MAFRHFIALDDLVAIDGPDSGHDLFVLDPLAAGLVDLMKLNLGTASGRWKKLDRNRDQSEPNLSSPDGPSSHYFTPMAQSRIQPSYQKTRSVCAMNL